MLVTEGWGTHWTTWNQKKPERTCVCTQQMNILCIYICLWYIQYIYNLIIHMCMYIYIYIIFIYTPRTQNDTCFIGTCLVLGVGLQKVEFIVASTYIYIPSRELTYPLKSPFWVDDFPFPQVGYVNFLEGIYIYTVYPKWEILRSGETHKEKLFEPLKISTKIYVFKPCEPQTHQAHFDLIFWGCRG